MDRSTRTKCRRELSIRISREGVVMPSSCTRCQERGIKCVVATRHSKKCAHCVRLGRTCDVEDIASKLHRIHQAEDRIKLEEEAAFEELVRAQERALRVQQEISVAVSRVTRLAQQRVSLKERGDDIMVRGLELLDEMDGEAEASAPADVAVGPAVPNSGSPRPLVDFLVPADNLTVDPADLDIPDEIFQQILASVEGST